MEVAAGGLCSISRQFKMETINREHIRVYIGVMEKMEAAVYSLAVQIVCG